MRFLNTLLGALACIASQLAPGQALAQLPDPPPEHWYGKIVRYDFIAPYAVVPPRHLVSFNLMDRTGRTVTDAELAGKFLVVNFAFTSCSLSCRAVNDRMAEIQRLIGEAPDIRLLSLSVDPRTDTPTALSKFADSFGADTNRWLFLTGDKNEMYRLIETSFISRTPELTGLVPGGFAHTDSIMLVDPRGRVWASFNGLKTNVAQSVVEEIHSRRQAK